MAAAGRGRAEADCEVKGRDRVEWAGGAGRRGSSLGSGVECAGMVSGHRRIVGRRNAGWEAAVESEAQTWRGREELRLTIR